jgi:hypothetical protein
MALQGQVIRNTGRIATPTHAESLARRPDATIGPRAASRRSRGG